MRFSGTPLKVLCSFALDQTGDFTPPSLTSSPERRGFAGTVEVIASAINLTTLCAIFKMTSAASLHYSWIAPSLPVNKSVSLCARGQRLPLPLDGETEDLADLAETVLDFKYFFFFFFKCGVFTRYVVGLYSPRQSAANIVKKDFLVLPAV